jgi:hypothetical protein
MKKRGAILFVSPLQENLQGVRIDPSFIDHRFIIDAVCPDGLNNTLFYGEILSP